MAIMDELQRIRQLAAAGEHEAARRLAEALPPAVVDQGEYVRAWPTVGESLAALAESGR